ncbi:uncharacterized protein [Miscanthus floridulus]|uniref:uncharacterized protein n=1 Tax=Miscanthus floridulus TaxID=154761 RepID=UPI003457FD39
MMAMLSSYTTTLLSRAPPAPAPAQGKSAVAAALQLRKEPAASSSPVVAARRPGWLLSSRAIAMRKISTAAYKYDMQPSESGGDWTITEDTNFITLRLKVGAKTTKDELEVAVTDDQVLLVIRYKQKQQGDGGGKEKDDSPKSSLPVQLLMPPGCDHKKVNARLFEGWLEIIVAKPKPSEEISITQ